MAKPKTQLGKLPPRFKFILNPYPTEKISSCPLCEKKNRQRTLPLLIFILPNTTFMLNHTCRYCPACDLLVGHKHEIEEFLTLGCRRNNPSVIGNEYVIVGTVEKSAWRESMAYPKPHSFAMEHTSDFAEYYGELEITQAGWFHVSQEPPVMQPPPSKDWVKARR